MCTKKPYIQPVVIEIEVDNDVNVLMSSAPTNGSGKTPPGWNNPHNPHNPHGKQAIEDNPFTNDIFGTSTFGE